MEIDPREVTIYNEALTVALTPSVNKRCHDERRKVTASVRGTEALWRRGQEAAVCRGGQRPEEASPAHVWPSEAPPADGEADSAVVRPAARGVGSGAWSAEQ